MFTPKKKIVLQQKWTVSAKPRAHYDKNKGKSRGRIFHTRLANQASGFRNVVTALHLPTFHKYG